MTNPMPKTAECMICFENKLCLPCGAGTVCEAMVCLDCKNNIWDAEFNLGGKHKEGGDDRCRCPFCKGWDRKYELLDSFKVWRGINSDLSCSMYVEMGNCCVMTDDQHDKWIKKQERESEREDWEKMTHAELIEELEYYQDLAESHQASKDHLMGELLEAKAEIEDDAKRGRGLCTIMLRRKEKRIEARNALYRFGCAFTFSGQPNHDGSRELIEIIENLGDREWETEFNESQDGRLTELI